MERMIAYCGAICSECPTYIATQKDDNEERKKVAELWSKQFRIDLKPEDINCDGCLTENGRLFGHCQTCEIRTCAREKGVKNCAYCEDFACEKLSKFFSRFPKAKQTLEEIRATL